MKMWDVYQNAIEKAEGKKNKKNQISVLLFVSVKLHHLKKKTLKVMFLQGSIWHYSHCIHTLFWDFKICLIWPSKAAMLC